MRGPTGIPVTLYCLQANLHADGRPEFQFNQHQTYKGSYGYRRTGGNTVRPKDIGYFSSYSRKDVDHFRVWLLEKPTDLDAAMKEFKAKVREALEERMHRQSDKLLQMQIDLNKTVQQKLAVESLKL